MESKKLLLGFISILIVMNFGGCDIEKDREKCEDSLVGLATCLPYVTGETAKGPPIDCCTGFTQVLKTHIDCICLLIKDRDDPSLGLKINATLALSLPAKCHTPTNESITDCPRILGLPPNSRDAKVFDDFAKSGNNSNIITNSTTAPLDKGKSSSTASSSSATANAKSNGSLVAGLFTAIIIALHISANS